LEGILNYFLYPISTAMVEGINNKIKLIKRKAYGYRNIEYFKLKIYPSLKEFYWVKEKLREIY